MIGVQGIRHPMISQNLDLRDIIAKIDLPGYIATHYPTSGAHTLRSGSICAVWRGDKNPSFSISHSEGTWLWHDFGLQTGGTIYEFLMKVQGMTPAQAASECKMLAAEPISRAYRVKSSKPPLVGLVDTDLQLLREAQTRLRGIVNIPPVLATRGFDWQLIEKNGLGQDVSGALWIPINRFGNVVAVKIRNPDGRNPRYRYLTGGCGTPALIIEGTQSNTAILVVEGELNAMVAHHALDMQYEVQGIAGANGVPEVSRFADRDILVYADGDSAGQIAVKKWCDNAYKNGANSVRVLETLPDDNDFCDFMGMHGVARVRDWLQSAIKNADVILALPTIVSDTNASKFPQLAEDALYGLLGNIVNAIAPTTEAHPAAVLFSLVVAISTALGNKIVFAAGNVSQPLRFFMLLVGDSCIGRKGTSWSAVKKILTFALGKAFFAENITNGLSTGEGLINCLRDEEIRIIDSQSVVIDAGVVDKRLLIIEPEFGRVLRVMQRNASTLSATIRSAWDVGPDDMLNILTKSSVRCTGAHIGMIGHSTITELLKLLTDTDLANGFANRFLIVSSIRTNSLPFGGDLTFEQTEELGNQPERLTEKIKEHEKSSSVKPIAPPNQQKIS